MTRKQSLLTLLLTTALIVGSAFAIYVDHLRKEENKIYLAMLHSFEGMPELREVAFLSSPTKCIFGPPKAAESIDKISEDFLRANSEGSMPIRLTLLEGKYNVVSWKDTQAIHETEGLALLFKKTDKRIVKLSRVGFSDDRRHALVCIEGDKIRQFFLLVNSSEEWKVALWMR